MIDRNWPIEFDDGTPAWWDTNNDYSICWIVLSAEKPFGVSMAKRGPLYSLLIDRDEGHPRIRNVDMPQLRFENGHAVAGATFKGPYHIEAWGEDGQLHQYAWPSLKNIVPGGRTIVSLNRKALENEERAAAEQAELEESDIYGLF